MSGPSASRFVAEVARFIGTPYVWGGDRPGGFDCSGLVYYALRTIGITSVPRTSEEQWGWVHKISKSQLRPGDLVFEQWPGEASPGHVAIYVGGGQIIQAPQPGENVQRVKWSPNIVRGEGGKVIGYGRVPGLSGTGASASGGGGKGGSGGSGAPVSTATLTAAQGASIGGLLAGTGNLVHGIAVIIDRLGAMFAPGQGYRTAFALAALLLVFFAYRAFVGGGIRA
jgi:hypothetical protein